MLIQSNRLFPVSCRSAILFIAIMCFLLFLSIFSSAVLGFYNYSTHFVLHLLYIYCTLCIIEFSFSTCFVLFCCFFLE